MNQSNEMFGYIDSIEPHRVIGWAWCSEFRLEPVSVDLFIDGKKLCSTTASTYREDLRSAGIGEGCHGFEFIVSSVDLDQSNRVEVMFSDTGISIPGSRTDYGSFYSAMRSPPKYRSRFGGLWIDLSNADDVIKGKQMLGFISDSEAAQLTLFRNNGYVILKQAVETNQVDAFLRDLDGVWSGSTDRPVFAETYDDDMVRVSRVKPDFKDRPSKVLDLHARYESARRLSFSESITRFLSLLFERPALGFQSLYFNRGVNQPIHQDTAYVRVSSPLEMAASWIALEDVKPGSGELEYYVGSHRLDEFLFGGSQKWMPPDSKQHNHYLQSLHEQSKKHGLKRERFLPRKGDALIWSADLAHGGTIVTDKQLTRKSMVTHYCPVNCDPVYGDNIECKKIPHNHKAFYCAVDRG